MKANQTNYKKTEHYAQNSNLIAQELHNDRKRIAEAAYFKAESRGFTTGHELDDWLEAEIEYGVCSTGNARLSLQTQHPIHLAHQVTSLPPLTVGNL